MKKYNFVIFGSDGDFYTIPYREVNEVDYAKYICTKIDTKNKILNLFYRLHCSQTTEKHVNLPFKSIWNGQYFKQKFDNDNPICFVFFRSHLKKLKYGYAEHLRKKYPNCKLGAFFQDLVKNTDINFIKQKLDFVVSFDQLDAEQHGLLYYPLVYTPEQYPVEEHPEQSDVFFVGKAKDRLDDILSAYEQLVDAGLKCDFHIIDVPEEKRKYTDKIVYRTQMPYVENLAHIKATKCMLEIMQQGGHGYTLRICEAITYGKKLLTNNPEVSKSPFYSPELISVINDFSKIDIDFVKRGDRTVDYGWKEQLSPLKLLDFIEENL